MNIKQLNEVFSIYSDGRFKYADIDAKAVYDNCINKDFGSHTFEEADEFKKFVNITPETDEEQLRALRNTLVKYWADYVKEYKGDDWGRSRSKEESDKEFKMGDQMQFFTTVIDMAIDNLPEDKRIQESLEGCYIVTMDGEPIGPNFKTRQEAVEWAERNYSIDDERIAIEFDPEPSYDEDEDLAESLDDEEDDYPYIVNIFDSRNDERITNYGFNNLSAAEECYKHVLQGISPEQYVEINKNEGENGYSVVKSSALEESKNEEYQITNQDRIMEIMETAETNLRNMIKRMK